MPSILITTSRKTSNRVRAFARDLSTVLPGSFRFNRGGMSLRELVSKISQEEATIAIVISTFRGNPGNIQFLTADGVVQYEIRIESAMLRREVDADIRNRIDELSMIVILENSSDALKLFSEFLSTNLSIPVTTTDRPESVPIGNSNQAYILLKESGRKTHWSWHLATNHIELGPRLRTTQLRSRSNDRE